MKDLFLKVAAISPKLKVADVSYNKEEILKHIKEEAKHGVKLAVFPELSLSSASCGDLFFQDSLIEACRKALRSLMEDTIDVDMLIFVGLPWRHNDKLYNVLACMHKGKLLGITPKRHLSDNSIKSEYRYFSLPDDEVAYRGDYIEYNEEYIAFGSNILYSCSNFKGLMIAAEIGEDAEAVFTPSMRHTQNGANLIVNASAASRGIGKSEERKALISSLSKRLRAAYIYASSSVTESSRSAVFAPARYIVQAGEIVSESEDFNDFVIRTELDMEAIYSIRAKDSIFKTHNENCHTINDFEFDLEDLILERKIGRFPWIKDEYEGIYTEILDTQALGLKKRLEHTGLKKLVIGLSGGLDSTLALLVAVRCFELMGLNKNDIYAITMPGFGTSTRTYDNALGLSKKLDVSFDEISIKDAVLQHFKDIGQDADKKDVTYENSQARERTQILMDIANMRSALVLGTGDLSELALGWATYNGDHMSMYSVNASLPKTLIRLMLKSLSEEEAYKDIKDILIDIVDTPVSPELLPTTEGDISQKTEDIVGPYELHDFFTYYLLSYGYSPKKIFRLAVEAFREDFSAEIILKYMKLFYRRFFAQQFKRSCMPDSPRVADLSLAAAADLDMPADAAASLFLDELEEIKV